MGWKDINMNRRRPQVRHTFIPVEPGLDLQMAVRRKAVGLAVAAFAEQVSPDGLARFADPELKGFALGYLAGFSSVRAMRDAANPDDPYAEENARALTAEIFRQIRDVLRIEAENVSFTVRGESRTAIRAPLVFTVPGAGAMADAGYLVGHLEGVCNSRKLVRQMLARRGHMGAGMAFLTDCDIAADPMQTRQPMMLLRFTPQERALILDAFQMKGQQ